VFWRKIDIMGFKRKFIEILNLNKSFFLGLKKTKLEDKGRRWIKKNKNFPFFLK